MVGLVVSGSATDCTPSTFESAAVTAATVAALSGSVSCWPSGALNTTVAVAAFWLVKRSCSRS